MQAEIYHLTLADLEAGLDHVRDSPKEQGVLELIVSRPEEDAREVMELADLDTKLGLVGDTWQDRPSARSADGKAHPDMQITIMNSRVAALVAQDKDRWQLSGDQLFTDLDLSSANVPPGTRISVGSAILEATDQPHTGCKKFSAHQFPYRQGTPTQGHQRQSGAERRDKTRRHGKETLGQPAK